MTRTWVVFVAVALTVLLARHQATLASDVELDDGNYDAWLQYVRPKQQELAWLTAIPWRPSLWEGAIEANRKQKPLLMWTMNGHPLACT